MTCPWPHSHSAGTRPGPPTACARTTLLSCPSWSLWVSPCVLLLLLLQRLHEWQRAHQLGGAGCRRHKEGLSESHVGTELAQGPPTASPGVSVEGVRLQRWLPGGVTGCVWDRLPQDGAEVSEAQLGWGGVGVWIPWCQDGLQEGPQGAEGQLWAVAWISGATRTASWSCRFGGKHLILFVFNQPCSLCSHQNPLVACGPHVGQGGRQQTFLLVHAVSLQVGTVSAGTQAGKQPPGTFPSCLAPPGLRCGSVLSS